MKVIAQKHNAAKGSALRLPVYVAVPVQRLNGEHALSHVEARLFVGEDVFPHQQRLRSHAQGSCQQQLMRHKGFRVWPIQFMQDAGIAVCPASAQAREGMRLTMTSPPAKYSITR